MNRPALGRGLGSLIPQKQTITEQVIPSAHREALEIPIDKIRPNPRQPRVHFSPSDLEDLIQSIKEHGVIQPVIVTESGDGYELIAGERRTRASRMLGLKTIPAIVREANEQQKLELALIENIQRQDLNAVEEALAYKALIEEFALTQDQVGVRVGKNRSTVANILRLLELPEDMLVTLKEGKISKSHARTLLAEPDQAKRRALFAMMLEGGMTVREAEARAGAGGGKAARREGQKGKDPNILAHEKRLKEILGTKVEIIEKNGGGKIVISYYAKPELIELLDRLSG